MVIMNLCLNHIYGFENFNINFSYPKKIVNSIIENEHLAGRPGFRYRKAVILMGANATGKTSLGKALLRIFKLINTGNPAFLFEMAPADTPATFSIDFVNKDTVLYRLSAKIDSAHEKVELQYAYTPIGEKDTYEKCAARLPESLREIRSESGILKELFGEIHFRFAYPEIEPSIKISGIKKDILLRSLSSVIGTLDPTLKDVSISKDLRDSFIIRRKDTEIIIQDGKLLNREVLSSGTAEGVDVAIFLASMLSGAGSFYYCDEHFSYIQTDIEKRIFGIMLGCLRENEQLIFTTHNTDMLDLNLPKHSYAFLRKYVDANSSHVSVIYASDLLKRNTDSLRSAVENDVFSSLPDDSLLDMLETGWEDE